MRTDKEAGQELANAARIFAGKVEKVETARERCAIVDEFCKKLSAWSKEIVEEAMDEFIARGRS